MNLKFIREKYQRDGTEENDRRGRNVEAINRFIEMLIVHENCDNLQIRTIAENFEYIDKIAPNFTIFQATENETPGYMPKFKAYQIGENSDLLAASHEFGHAVLSILNNTQVPENFEEIIVNAKEHAVPKNKEFFKSYIESLSKNTKERSDAEVGPISDIISAIFQQTGFRINTPENICLLPAFHKREYYYDEENKSIKTNKVFDEIFANYYALKSNNCFEELEILKNLFGDELVKTLDIELEKAQGNLLSTKQKDEDNRLTPIEKIKGLIIGERSGDVKEIKENQYLTEKEEERINE